MCVRRGYNVGNILESVPKLRVSLIVFILHDKVHDYQHIAYFFFLTSVEFITRYRGEGLFGLLKHSGNYGYHLR